MKDNKQPYEMGAYIQPTNERDDSRQSVLVSVDNKSRSVEKIQKNVSGIDDVSIVLSRGEA